MRALLVFLDGTICDIRNSRILWRGGDDYYSDENIMSDEATNGSVSIMNELAKSYRLVYVGERPEEYVSITRQWLTKTGFPDGDVYLGETQKERMRIIVKLKNQFDFAAGIGKSWEDDELLLELGCQSFILMEWKPNWDTVRKYLPAV